MLIGTRQCRAPIRIGRRRTDLNKREGYFMNRRAMAGFFAIVCFSVSSLAFAPRTASAVMAVQGGCDARLAFCADNATNNYDNCVCNVNAYAPGCTSTVAPSFGLSPAPSSIPACVVQLQGDLVKCQGAYLVCKLIGGGKTTAPAN
jgi:hypothetical protein